MFLLLPTCDAYAPVASIGLALLRRYWADHPPAHVLHHRVKPGLEPVHRVEFHESGPDGSAWLGNVVRFLEGWTEATFLLMLDDYGMCAPPRRETICDARRLMEADPRVGVFPLSWYPARERAARGGWPGIETLTGTPILLQAGIWRRETFLELSRTMGPRTCAHGFERLATQRAKRLGIEICAARMPAPRWVGGHFLDGLDKSDWPLPYHNLMHAGRLDPTHERFLREHGFAPPAAGLGDTIERIARISGVSRVVRWAGAATGTDCGCDRRRDALNRWVPYR